MIIGAAAVSAPAPIVGARGGRESMGRTSKRRRARSLERDYHFSPALVAHLKGHRMPRNRQRIE